MNDNKYILGEREEMTTFLEFCRSHGFKLDKTSIELLWIDVYASRYSGGERKFNYEEELNNGLLKRLEDA